MSGKFYCKNHHAWYGQFSDAICPVCHQPPLGLVQMAAYVPVLKRVENGIVRSVAIHGDWSGYGLARIAWVIAMEAWEVAWALIRLDIHGRHGVIAELHDLAIVCVKGIERLAKVSRR